MGGRPGPDVKIRIDVNLTPEEARRFFGLPDVKPFQDELLESMAEKVRAGTEGLDPSAFMAPFMATNISAYEAMQKAFWKGLAGTSGEADENP